MGLPENQYTSVTALAACSASGAVAMALCNSDLLHSVRFAGRKLTDHNGTGSGASTASMASVAPAAVGGLLRPGRWVVQEAGILHGITVPAG